MNRRVGLLALGAALLLAQPVCAIEEVLLTELPTGSYFRFDAPKPRNYDSGTKCLSGIGDFNGDGVDDIAIADHLGKTWVVFGSDFPSTSPVSPINLNGRNGFELQLVPAGYYDRAQDLSGLGDINGDGFDDFGIGTFFSNCIVVFGTDTVMPAKSTYKALLESGRGFENYSGLYGSIAGAGDVNGDGFDDFVVGIPDDPDRHISAAYIIFGSDQGFPNKFSYSEMLQDRGIIFRDCDFTDYLGNRVSGVGDVNGDGFDDVAITGAPFGNEFIDYKGKAFILFGSPSLTSSILCTQDVNNKMGFYVEGRYKGRFKTLDKIASMGDVNGDGLADFMAGVNQDPQGKGESYLCYGVAGSGENIDLSLQGDWTTFQLSPIAIQFHAAPGDTNKDGNFDLFFGVPGSYLGAGSGIVLEASDDIPSTVTLGDLPNQKGQVFISPENSMGGFPIGTPGDFNDDGISDALIGIPYQPSNPGPSNGYLVYGHTDETSATYKTYVAPADSISRGVGELRSGKTSSPESRLWIEYSGGHDGTSSASLQTATIHRSAGQVSNLRNKANVLWHTSSNRVEWSDARVMVKYINREIEGLREEDLILYHAISPEGPWVPCEDQQRDVMRNRISGVVQELGYFALAAEPSGDVNMDEVLDAADVVRLTVLVESGDALTTEVLLRGDLYPMVTGDDQLTTGDVEVLRGMIIKGEG